MINLQHTALSVYSSMHVCTCKELIAIVKYEDALQATFRGMEDNETIGPGAYYINIQSGPY